MLLNKVRATARLLPRPDAIPDPASCVRVDDGVACTATTHAAPSVVARSGAFWTVENWALDRLGFDVLVTGVEGVVEFTAVLATDPDLKGAVYLNNTGAVQEQGRMLVGITRDRVVDAVTELQPASRMFLSVAAIVRPGNSVRWSAFQRRLWN